MKYVCVKDYEDFNYSLGKAKTIEEWKHWLLEDRLEEFYNLSLIFDENAMGKYIEMVNLKEDKVISYIQDYFDIKLIPLENEEQKYLIIDEAKLITEKELRRILLREETQDILNNDIDYINGDLSLDNQLKCIKDTLDSSIDNLIETANDSWGIPVMKIEGV